MTTLTTETAPATRASAAPAGRPRLSFARLVRAEWIKFASVRSTVWAFAVVAVISIGLSLLQAAAYASFGPDAGTLSVAEANRSAVMVILFSTMLTQLVAVIVGVISVTGEYSTGMIRSTLTAAPGRVGALAAKALVVAVAMFVFSLVVFAVAALVTGPILPSGMLDLSDPGSSLMPLLGAALYLALVSILGVGIGFVVRNGPGALATAIVLIFVAPILVMFFPRTPDFEWIQTLAGYLPSNAGQSLFMGSPLSGIGLEPWPAVLTLIAWAVGALIAGAAVLKARDA